VKGRERNWFSMEGGGEVREMKMEEGKGNGIDGDRLSFGDEGRKMQK
jgi:hypothetical protein